jgi:RNA polymerase I-specific transcription initiation factor RRN7
VCKDVWALHLSLLPESVPAKPSGLTQGTNDAKNETTLLGVPENEEVERNEEEGSSSSSSSDENDDPVLKALMRQNSESPSSSNSSEDEDLKPSPNKKEGLSRKHLKRHEGPRSTISVLMVACWIMRIPVMYRDFVMSVRVHCVILYLMS